MEMALQILYVVSNQVNIFLPKSPEEYASLRESIREWGLRHPILLWHGLIFDGFHRLRACLELGIEPRFEVLPDDSDPLEIVADMTTNGRNLNETARAAAALVAMGRPKPGRPRGSRKNGANLRGSRTREWAATKFGVSKGTITKVAKILDPAGVAIPDLRRAVREGSLAADDAVRALKETPEVQRQAMDMISGGKATKFARAVAIVKRNMNGVETASAEIPWAVAAKADVALHASTVAGLKDLVDPGTVDRIITFPPAGGNHRDLMADLAGFAAHSLKQSGAMFVLAGTDNLPMFIEALRHDELNWICGFHYTHPGNNYRSNATHKSPLTQKLVLVLGKSEFRLDAGYDVITVPPLPEANGRDAFNPRLGAGFEAIINRFTSPHHTVADPVMAGRTDSALAAEKLGRSFIGAWSDQAFIDRLRARLDLVSRPDDGEVSDGQDIQTGLRPNEVEF